MKTKRKRTVISGVVLAMFLVYAGNVFGQESKESNLTRLTRILPGLAEKARTSDVNNSRDGIDSSNSTDVGNFLKADRLASQETAVGKAADTGIQLTGSGYNKLFTDWSPGGKWITYAEYGDDGLSDIWIIPSSGGDPVNLTGNLVGNYLFPCFYDDSTLIYTNNAALSVEILNFETGEREILLDNAVRGCFSNSGRYFVFRFADDASLAIVDLELEDSWGLADGDNSYGISCFTPDEKYIITSVLTESGEKLFRTSIEGGGLEQLTNNEGRHWFPNVSPDGIWVLYTYFDMDYYDSRIMAYNMESGESQLVLNDVGPVQSSPSFSANGLRFCYLLDTDGIYEVCVAGFPFAEIPAPELDITAPDGGETLIAGEYYDIQWEAVGMGKVVIQYSIDGGSTWNIIAEGVAASDGWYGWESIPDVSSDNCFLRITGAALDGSGVVEDWSDGTFSISGATYLRVTNPHGNEQWEVGGTYDIKWESQNVEKIRIAYSLDNGSSWTRIVRDVDAASGSFTWTIPSDLPAAKLCRIRIVDESNDEIYSESYSTFSIINTDTTPYLRVISPNGGEELEILKDYEITWEARNVNTITIMYATDGGVHWKSVAANVDATTGSFIWSVPDDPSTACRIMLKDESSSGLTVRSDDNFSILRAYNEPWVRVISPNGGETLKGGVVRNILWEPSGELTIQIRLSIDGGDSWEVIADDITGNAGAYEWAVPYNIASTDCYLWVGDPGYAKRYDTNDEPFTITLSKTNTGIQVLSPNGSEEFQTSSVVEISWSAVEVDVVTISYSTDNGVNWVPIIEGMNSSLGSFRWAIPTGLITPACYIRVGNTSDETVYDVSDGSFSIINGGSSGLQATNFFPLQIGATWKGNGEVSDADGNITDSYEYSSTVSGTKEVNGLNYWVLGDDDGDGLVRIGNNIVWAYTGDISALKGKAIAKIAKAVKASAENELPMYNFNVPQGGSWTIYSWAESGDGWDSYSSYTGEFIGRESIGVTAGSFADCAVFQAHYISIYNSSSSTSSDAESVTYRTVSTDTVWLAPGVGPIQYAEQYKDFENGVLVYEESTTERLSSFTIEGGATLSLLNPSGGEQFAAGSELMIQWTSQGVASVNIGYTTDGFSSDKIIAENWDASLGYYSWIIPEDIESSDCYVWISDASDDNISDSNKEPFSVYAKLTNENAVFSLDTDLATIGHQANIPITGINAGDEVGFMIYAGEWLTTSTAVITLNWDGTLADLDYMFDTIIGGQVIMNGQEITMPAEKNLFTRAGYSALANIVDSSEGSAKISYTGSGVSTTDTASLSSGMVIFVAMKTKDAFSSADSLIVNVEINLSDLGGGVKNLGVRTFRAFQSQKMVNVLTPTSGDVLTGGQSFITTWESNGVSRVLIELSVDNGQSWSVLAETADASAGKFQFTLPDLSSSECLIRISDSENNTITSTSGLFTIKTTVEQYITILSPAGGESWAAGSTHTISWESAGVEDIFITINWQNYASGEWYYLYDGSEHIDASLGSLSWTIPEDINSTDCNIWIGANDAEGVEDVSEKFTIYTGTQQPSLTLLSPEGGEEWTVGSTQRIEWEAVDVPYIEIVILYDGVDGQLYYLATDTVNVDASIGYYDWFVAVPSGITPTDCYIFVRKTDNYSINDYNTTPFSIVEDGIEASLELINPNGGEQWYVRSEQNIRWRSSSIEQVNIEYSIDNGSTWKYIVKNVPASTGVIAALGSYRWMVPDEVSANCLVRISDASNSNLNDVSAGTFSIISGNFLTVTAPEESNVWSVGAEYEIRWTYEGVENVKLEYSTNSGADWIVIDDSEAASAASYLWTVPDAVSSQCIIRVTDVSNEAIYGESGLFTISEPKITIEHSPITTAAENQEFTFNAQVTSDADIDKVILYYRKTGNGSFDNQLEMTDSGNGKFTGKIVAGIFTAPGMEYYIVARDSNNNEARNPVDNEFHSITAQVVDIKSTYTVTGGSVQTSYRMVSIPLVLSNTNITDQLTGRLPTGTQGPDWRLFRYSAGSTTPAEYPNIQGFTPGTAYWVITTENYQLSAARGTTVTTGESFKIELKQGWNDIANPWMFNISWDNKDNPSGANLDIYSYDGKWTGPNSVTTMAPWRGYSVYNYESSARIIYLKPGATNIQKDIADTSEPEWSIAIEATAADAEDSANYFGVRTDAAIEWDRYDHVEPPVIGEYVSVVFPHSDWSKYPYNYTVDFRPPEDSISWDFNVLTNIGSENVQVTLEGMDTLPSESFLYIIDHNTGEAVNLNGNSFDFKSDSNLTERQFTLVVSNDEDLMRDGTKSLPEQFVTAACYPNPFNPQTTIKYTISMPGLVKVTVFNALGQSVREYDIGFKQQGSHDLVFNARDLTSGLYFYKVESGKASVTEKMLFMK